ncbi:MAG TPA: FIST N-terminal domain-containing protein, partial [Lamprocystis sp. (in: g-proteobacteria)]|nr:FIST N-terminal domain-containing protein [Lamprocystis sp. (in: g-proteobacteria)]
MQPFRYAHAEGADWREIADDCLGQIGPVPGGVNLGFLYVTDSLADELGELLAYLADDTGVKEWVGAVGIGICATGAEYYEEPAVALMLGEFPVGSFRVFPSVVKDMDSFDAHNRDWIKVHQPMLALVHGDTVTADTEDLIQQLAARTTTGFLVGGLASSRGTNYTIANGLAQGGFSGVLFGQDVGLITRLSQGCTPIGPHHTITSAQRNILMTLDGRPALDVLKADIGEELSRDLMRIGATIFVGLPI